MTNSQQEGPDASTATIIESVSALSDEALRTVITHANALLESRAAAARQEAVAEIRRLARTNGMAVRVKMPARKRGRPRKAGPAGQ